MKSTKAVSRSGPGSSLDILPPEIVLNILNKVEVDDYLVVKLTCKAFNTYLPETLSSKARAAHSEHSGNICTFCLGKRDDSAWTGYGRDLTQPLIMLKCPKRIVLNAHVRLESSIRSIGQRKHLLCTDCGLHKLRAKFADNQAGKRLYITNVDGKKLFGRTCVACGVGNYQFSYGRYGTFLLGKKKVIACRFCKETCEEAKGVFDPYANEESRLDLSKSQSFTTCCKPCATKKSWEVQNAADGVGYFRVRPD